MFFLFIDTIFISDNETERSVYGAYPEGYALYTMLGQVYYYFASFIISHVYLLIRRYDFTAMQEEVMKVWEDMNVRLSNFVSGKVNDPELTKDIVQDVFLKVFSKNETLNNKNKLVSWIYQITRNEVINHFRNVNSYDPSVDLEEEEINDTKLTSELAKCVRPVIDSLPPKYKEALILSDIENVPQKEIAKRLNISYSGLKSRVQRAREMLKSTCEQCCDISTDVYGDILDYKLKEHNGDCSEGQCN